MLRWIHLPRSPQAPSSLAGSPWPSTAQRTLPTAVWPCRIFKAADACSAPSQDRARIALPAGHVPSTSCHRVPCLSSTVRFPTCSMRVRPEVKKISRVGTCVVSPSAFASAAPFATTTSPLAGSMPSTTAVVEGGRSPKRLVTGRAYVPGAMRSHFPSRVKRVSVWSTAALDARCRNSLGESKPPPGKAHATDRIVSARWLMASTFVRRVYLFPDKWSMGGFVLSRPALIGMCIDKLTRSCPSQSRYLRSGEFCQRSQGHVRASRKLN
jgi:hypothetical protein